MLNNDKFYDQLSSIYDSMINFDNAVFKKQKYLNLLLDQRTGSAADLGCGSGADSVALTNLGFSVAAFEPSSEMIKQAKNNFVSRNVNVEIYQNKIADINKLLHNSFDVVISLGNAFANINCNEIEDSVKKTFDLLKDEGKVIIQLLNYDKVLKRKERIVNITTSGKQLFIRFYDFADDKLFFNILSFDKTDYSKRKLITTEIFPHKKSIIEKYFIESKFSKIEFFSDLEMNKFDEAESNDLVVIAEK